MSQDDLFEGLARGVRRAGHIVDELMDDHAPRRFRGGAAGLLDRRTLASRKFWTGAALGAAAVLTLAAIAGRRGAPGKQGEP
ncbi:hypothetical protein [Blastochloris sulfoviridis]|uniref:DUF3618 domain-containing protein n=1 Tax=Blastochloris sulfoviridis TaxID=50712 RepID=A0A5M6I3T0_9HYPH|nr:hypothetical protein [Blastochloris sulfoviridis]KAA5602860.1 hypothetical protein F1193_03210 [Blastochloris sulfoviridis]